MGNFVMLVECKKFIVRFLPMLIFNGSGGYQRFILGMLAHPRPELSNLSTLAKTNQFKPSQIIPGLDQS